MRKKQANYKTQSVEIKLTNSKKKFHMNESEIWK